MIPKIIADFFQTSPLTIDKECLSNNNPSQCMGPVAPLDQYNDKLRICLDSIKCSAKSSNEPVYGGPHIFDVIPKGTAVFCNGTNVFSQVPLINGIANWSFSPSKNGDHFTKDNCRQFIDHSNIDFTKSIKGTTEFVCNKGIATLFANDKEIATAPIVNGTAFFIPNESLKPDDYMVQVKMNTKLRVDTEYSYIPNKPYPTSRIKVFPVEGESLSSDEIKDITTMFEHILTENCLGGFVKLSTSDVKKKIAKKMGPIICNNFEASLYCAPRGKRNAKGYYPCEVSASVPNRDKVFELLSGSEKEREFDMTLFEKLFNGCWPQVLLEQSN